MELLEVEMAVPNREPKTITDEAEKVEKLIRFVIGDRPFYVRAASVAEVVLPLKVSRVPNSPAWLQGLAGSRGDLVAVIEPTVIWKGPRPAESQRARGIVFHPIAKAIKMALPVDEVSDLVEFPLLTGDGAEDDGPVKKISFQDGHISLIEPGSLLEFLSPGSM